MSDKSGPLAGDWAVNLNGVTSQEQVALQAAELRALRCSEGGLVVGRDHANPCASGWGDHLEQDGLADGPRLLFGAGAPARHALEPPEPSEPRRKPPASDAEILALVAEWVEAEVELDRLQSQRDWSGFDWEDLPPRGSAAAGEAAAARLTALKDAALPWAEAERFDHHPNMLKPHRKEAKMGDSPATPSGADEARREVWRGHYRAAMTGLLASGKFDFKRVELEGILSPRAAAIADAMLTEEDARFGG